MFTHDKLFRAAGCALRLGRRPKCCLLICLLCATESQLVRYSGLAITELDSSSIHSWKIAQGLSVKNLAFCRYERTRWGRCFQQQFGLRRAEIRNFVIYTFDLDQRGPRMARRKFGAWVIYNSNVLFLFS